MISCLICLHIGMCVMCMSGAHRVKKRVLDPLEAECRALVSRGCVYRYCHVLDFSSRCPLSSSAPPSLNWVNQMAQCTGQGRRSGGTGLAPWAGSTPLCRKLQETQLEVLVRGRIRSRAPGQDERQSGPEDFGMHGSLWLTRGSLACQARMLAHTQADPRLNLASASGMQSKSGDLTFNLPRPIFSPVLLGYPLEVVGIV